MVVVFNDFHQMSKVLSQVEYGHVNMEASNLTYEIGHMEKFLLDNKPPLKILPLW